MKILQHTGLTIFVVALLLFVAMLGLDQYMLSEERINIGNPHHQEAITSALLSSGLEGQNFTSSFNFAASMKKIIAEASKTLESQYKAGNAPEGVSEWDYKLGAWKVDEYLFSLSRSAGHGLVSNNPGLFWWLTVGLGSLGGLLFIIPKFLTPPGIKHNGIYHHPLTRGIKKGWRAFFITATILGVFLYGISYMNQYFWPVLSLSIGVLIVVGVLFIQKSIKNNPVKSASPEMSSAWIGIVGGFFLISFYVLLYWAPHHILPWIKMCDPLSSRLNGGLASNWFLYGMLYTVLVFVMGIRMASKYRHNTYQLARTGSVVFFQTAFAFLIPELLVRMNKPYYDFKNIWPLDYSFFMIISWMAL